MGRHALLTASMPGATTTTTDAGFSGARLASTWPIIGRPAMGCSTFGKSDFIRVPLPAARTMAAVVELAMIGFLLLLISRQNRAANCHSASRVKLALGRDRIRLVINPPAHQTRIGLWQPHQQSRLVWAARWWAAPPISPTR
jgi:hypothetical protein